MCTSLAINLPIALTEKLRHREVVHLGQGPRAEAPTTARVLKCPVSLKLQDSRDWKEARCVRLYQGVGQVRPLQAARASGQTHQDPRPDTQGLQRWPRNRENRQKEEEGNGRAVARRCTVTSRTGFRFVSLSHSAVVSASCASLSEPPLLMG